MLGMFVLMTTTMTVHRDVIGMLKDAGTRNRVKVMVGGVSISWKWANKISADCHSESASEQVERAKMFLRCTDLPIVPCATDCIFYM